jgi:hypothetical protein
MPSAIHGGVSIETQNRTLPSPQLIPAFKFVLVFIGSPPFFLLDAFSGTAGGS